MKEVIFKITNENYYKMLFVCKLAGFDLKDFLNEHLTHVDFNGTRTDIYDMTGYTEEYKKFKKEVRKRESK